MIGSLAEVSGQIAYRRHRFAGDDDRQPSAAKIGSASQRLAGQRATGMSGQRSAGDRLWRRKVTNFDAEHPALGTLHIDYEQ